MTRRIRTTRQARECRRLAIARTIRIEWLAVIAENVPAELDYWATRPGFKQAQAFLAKRAEMKRGEQ